MNIFNLVTLEGFIIATVEEASFIKAKKILSKNVYDNASH